MTEDDTGPIDRSALDALLEITGGDPAFLAELVDTFLADAVDLLAAMERACERGDAAELRRAAHSLKSNGATFGAPALTAIARRIEGLGAAEHLDGAAPLVDDARREFARVERALRAIRAAL